MSGESASAALLALCKDVLAAAGEPEVEMYARVRERGFARFAIGELGQHMEVQEPEVLVRVARGKRVAEASASRLDRDALVDVVREASRAASVVPEQQEFAGFAGADEETGEAPLRYVGATATATADERVARLAPVLAAIREAGLVSAGALETASIAQCVATTRGLARAHDATTAGFKVWALETPGAGGAAGYGGALHRDVRALDLAGQTARAIARCKMGADPIALDAGSYDVVMEPEAVSEMLEWLGAIAFGAAEIEQGTSPAAGRAGERITGEAITITEDPLDATDVGFGAPFDREGVWRRRVPLITSGVAREVLYDRLHAARMGARSTGSAIVSDLGGGGSVGATSLHLAPGTAESVEELVAGVARGLYVCRLHYVNGFLEPRRAVMTGLTRDGCFLIEHGKLTRAVGNLRFTDSFLEGLGRCDGMTRARAAIPTWWSDAGACVVPAIRMRGFRFTSGSQVRPALR